jgi:osmoprotectant transport system ATP-binding protein
VRKTIVFVTHDVDEAIKMADRIAIMQRGGKVAQFDTPDAILANPANEFVERFVGADRGLKRLSLSRVRELPLIEPVTARLGESPSAARDRLEAAGVGYLLLVDERRRPVGWLSRADLRHEAPLDADHAIPGATPVQPESTLRDALSAMLASSVQLGVVVDASDAVLGLISVDAISNLLQQPPAA